MRKKISGLVLSASLIFSLSLTSAVPVSAAEAVSEAETAAPPDASSAQEAQGEPAVVIAGTVKTASGNLNVRASASTDAPIAGKLPNQTPVIIVKTENNWHYITYKGLAGWVSGDFITNIGPRTATEVSRSGDAAGRGQVEDIIKYAMTLRGKPYKSGGSGPNGFDCSGYVSYVFNHFGVSVPRSSHEYPSFGQKVARNELLPGDIICSDTSGKIDGGISHVAIYVGNGQFIHAASGGKRQIQINSLSEEYYDKRYVCAVRVL